jgi:hypothetical protein
MEVEKVMSMQGRDGEGSYLQNSGIQSRGFHTYGKLYLARAIELYKEYNGIETNRRFGKKNGIGGSSSSSSSSSSSRLIQNCRLRVLVRTEYAGLHAIRTRFNAGIESSLLQEGSAGIIVFIIIIAIII